MINPAIQLTSAEKLDLLRRLDRFRPWQSLEDQRLCLECGKIITGEQIQVSDGAGAFDPLRVTCPTPGCASTPMDWALLETDGFHPWDNGPAVAERRKRDGIADAPGATSGSAAAEADALALGVLRKAWRGFRAARRAGSRR